MPRGIPKNKKVPAHALEKGNPDWNLKGVTPTDVLTAPSAVTAEDLAFESELQRMSGEEIIPDIDQEYIAPLTKEKRDGNHLRDHMENYRPAQSINELDTQVAVAKPLGAEIDVTPQVMKHIFGPKYNLSSGMYRDVQLNLPETFEANVAKSKVSLEQHLFGNSKVKG